MLTTKKLSRDDLTDTIQQIAYRDHCRLKTPTYLGSTSLHTQTMLLLQEVESLFLNLDGTNSFSGLALQEVTFNPALTTYQREIYDNALDEFSHGFGNRLEVTYDEVTLETTIKDNGRGIPHDKALIALTEPMTGRNFGERKEVVGTNGLGASIVSNTSESFNFKVWRDGKKIEYFISEGDPEIGGKLEISDPVITQCNKALTGTSVNFKPSKHVFKHKTLPNNYVKTRLFEIAVCNPQYEIYYNGERLKISPNVEQTLFPQHKSINIDIIDEDQKFRSRFWLVPNFLETGDHCHTVVNNIFALNGGSHIEAFQKKFSQQLLNNLERESKRRRLAPNKSDVVEGLLVYNITTMLQPDFDSQSKTRLINEEAGEIIRRFLDNEEFFKEFIKKNKDWIEEIYQRCANRTKKKDASDIAKLSRKNLRIKIPALTDAISKQRSRCMLFLAEGTSAESGMLNVRDPEIHGGLALRGKVMNVNGESPKKVLDNQCLTQIMNSIGLLIGEKANRSNLRYGKVYLAMDADEDGKHIAALLVNFFFTYWPELFDQLQPPFIYIFQTPFVIAEKGKQRKYWYSHNYNEFDPNDWTGWSITRAKGLGTLTEEDWIYSLKNPVAVPIIDDGQMAESLDLVFNSARANDRKKWIGL